jgi:hypothetical protein
MAEVIEIDNNSAAFFEDFLSTRVPFASKHCEIGHRQESMLRIGIQTRLGTNDKNKRV